MPSDVAARQRKRCGEGQYNTAPDRLMRADWRVDSLLQFARWNRRDGGDPSHSRDPTPPRAERLTRRLTMGPHLGMRSLVGSLLLSCVAASRKMLLLHGAGSSSGAFLNLGAMAMLRAAASSYHDSGPHAWQITGMDWDSELDAVTDYGQFWLADNPRSFDAAATTACDAAISRIEDTLREGGYHGLMGFSTGAVVASIVAARAALAEEGAATNLAFAVFINGAAPTPYEALMQRLTASSPILELPTLHCLSQADAFAERGATLAACFGPHAAVQWHDAGHAMPPRSFCSEVISWCDRQCPMGDKFS